jgi:hypothetical protein
MKTVNKRRILICEKDFNVDSSMPSLKQPEKPGYF